MSQTPIDTLKSTPKDLILPLLVISIPTVVIVLVLDYASTYLFVEYIKPLGKGDIDSGGINTLMAMFSLIAFPLAFIGTSIATKFVSGQFTEKSIKNLGYYCSVAIVVSLAVFSSPFVLGAIGYSIFLLPKLLKRWLKEKIIQDSLQSNQEPSL